jgi:hypothetical protein
MTEHKPHKILRILCHGFRRRTEGEVRLKAYKKGENGYNRVKRYLWFATIYLQIIFLI